MLECDQNDCDSLPSSRALRHAIICIGWLKLASVLWYMLLFFLTAAKSRGEMSTALRYMLLAALPCQLASALLLFYSALEEKLVAAEVSVWLCLGVGTYNLVLGLLGCIYFIRTGSVDAHFVLAFLYVLLGLSVFTVLCHDVLVVFAYKQLLQCGEKQCPGFE